MILRFVAAAGLVLLTVGCATTIAGTVSAPGVTRFNADEARVNVALLNPADQRPFSLVLPVQPSGAFETNEDLPHGRYLVEALIPGFEASSQTVEVDSSKKLIIELVPLKTEASKSVRANMGLEVDRGTGGAMLTPPNL